MAYLTPHLTQLDTTTQSISVANTPQIITFDTAIFSHKIVRTSSSRFTFNERGEYIVLIAPNAVSSSANTILDIWLRINGTDITNSNTKTLVVNTNDAKRPSISFGITITAGQYLEIWMSGDSTNLSLAAHAAGVTPTRPLTPSVYMTLEKLA